MKEGKDAKIEMIPVALIDADENQPRRTFDATRLTELAASIKQQGIINPLTVERNGQRYLLVDGERRFRASCLLKLKTVPAVVVERMTPGERLVKQFHLQEQHQGWSGLEKAMAVGRLMNELGLDVPGIAELLSLPKSTINEYEGFWKLIEKKEFEKHEIPVTYAKAIVSLRDFIEREFVRNDDVFGVENQRALERGIIERIKSGDIKKKGDLLKIRDSVKVDHKSVLKFLKNPELATNKLFVESQARVAYCARNVKNSMAVLKTNIKSGLAVGLVEHLNEEGNEVIRTEIKSGARVLQDLARQLD